MTEQLEQRTWFRLFWQKKLIPAVCQTPYTPDIRRYHQKKSESSALLQSFCHFSYNENSMRAPNITSLIWYFPSTDAIERRKKIHGCVWRFKVASCKCASLKSSRFSQIKIRSDTFLTEWWDIWNYIFNVISSLCQLTPEYISQKM